MVLAVLGALDGRLADFGERHISLIAAGVAFFGMFAIFPAIAAVIAIFGLVADPIVVVQQLELLEEIIPPDAYLLLVGQMGRLLAAGSGTLGWATLFSIALALWAARAGVAGLMGGLNAIADKPPRNGFKQALVALTLTLVLVALALTAMMAVIVAPVVLAFAPIAASSAAILEGVRWLVAFFVLLCRTQPFVPVRPQPARCAHSLADGRCGHGDRVVDRGVRRVVLLLTNFASYNEVYGSIGAVIGMLLWLYITAYLILLGAALNLEVHGRVAGDRAD